jgi:hypothetical protein
MTSHTSDRPNDLWNDSYAGNVTLNDTTTISSSMGLASVDGYMFVKGSDRQTFATPYPWLVVRFAPGVYRGISLQNFLQKYLDLSKHLEHSHASRYKGRYTGNFGKCRPRPTPFDLLCVRDQYLHLSCDFRFVFCG